MIMVFGGVRYSPILLERPRPRARLFFQGPCGTNLLLRNYRQTAPAWTFVCAGNRAISGPESGDSEPNLRIVVAASFQPEFRSLTAGFLCHDDFGNLEKSCVDPEAEIAKSKAMAPHLAVTPLRSWRLGEVQLPGNVCVQRGSPIDF